VKVKILKGAINASTTTVVLIVWTAMLAACLALCDWNAACAGVCGLATGLIVGHRDDMEDQ
jgi:hypothetical protein